MSRTFTAFMRRVTCEAGFGTMFALCNRSASRTVRLDYLRVLPAGGCEGGGASGLMPSGELLRIARISAHSGGSVISPRKRDTNSPDLPSQVEFRVMAESRTETEAIARRMPLPGFPGLGQPMTHLPKTVGGFFRPGGGHLSMASAFRTTLLGDVEPIVIRPGEGVALIQETFPFVCRAFGVAMLVRNLATGATYSCFTQQTGTPDLSEGAIFSLMNGAGSGVNLEVLAIEIPEDGTDARRGTVRLHFTEAHSLGTAVDCVAHDTNNVLPPDVSVQQGPLYTYAQGEQLGGGSFESRTIVASATAHRSGIEAGIVRRKPVNFQPNAGALQSHFSPWAEEFEVCSERRGRIYVPPGSALALSVDSNRGLWTGVCDLDAPSILFFNIEARFTVEDPSAMPAASAGAYIS